MFESAISNLKQQDKGVYLQENQGWEFAFIHVWKKYFNKQIIGFPHSSVRYWDLRYFYDSRSYDNESNCDLPVPDKIACNGEYVKKMYFMSDFPKKNLIKVESLRYLYLLNQKKQLK